MPHSHYVMDLYFQDGAKPDKPRHEALRIVADSDDDAVTEGKRIDGWKKPSSFQIRSIRTSTRSGDKVIYTSPAAETDDAADATIAQPAT
jgi:hypothetical protein